MYCNHNTCTDTFAKASQTAELKLPKFQTSSTPPQVTNPRTTNHLYVPTTPKPILKGSNKLTRPQKKLKFRQFKQSPQNRLK